MKQTAMQNLREDLILTQISVKESLLEIKNQEIREACQKVVSLTLKNIIKRIDEELLETEKQQIIRTFTFAEYSICINSGEEYYNETFKNK
jgi:hypothetical protein